MPEYPLKMLVVRCLDCAWPSNDLSDLEPNLVRDVIVEHHLTTAHTVVFTGQVGSDIPPVLREAIGEMMRGEGTVRVPKHG